MWKPKLMVHHNWKSMLGNHQPSFKAMRQLIFAYINSQTIFGIYKDFNIPSAIKCKFMITIRIFICRVESYNRALQALQFLKLELSFSSKDYLQQKVPSKNNTNYERIIYRMRDLFSTAWFLITLMIVKHTTNILLCACKQKGKW